MKKLCYVTKIIICGYIVFCLIAWFDEIKVEIEGALKMWAGVLLPSLFPYLVLSQYITSSGMLSVFSSPEKAIARLYNISRCGAGVYVCSLVCGYPSGAICSRNLYQKGMIQKEEAERLICFTNNAGPLFLISAVGSCMLGCTKDGIAIYVIQNISAAMTAILLGIKADKIKESSHIVQNDPKPLTECCSSAVTTILAIGGYVMMAACIGKMALIALEGLPIYTSFAKCGVYFVLEISSAMKALALLGNTRPVFALICAAASWAGVSVIMQIKSVIPREFSIKKLIYARLAQSGASFLMGYVYKSSADYCSGCNGNGEWIYISLCASAVIFGIYMILKSRLSLHPCREPNINNIHSRE